MRVLTVLSALAGCPALCAFVSGDFPELEGQSEEQVGLDLSCAHCIRSSKVKVTSCSFKTIFSGFYVQLTGVKKTLSSAR
jgi:hypothetical protein